MTTERVHFRLIKMPCCNFLACWVNPRFPSYCPECGTRVFPEVRGCVMMNDDTATIKYSEKMDLMPRKLYLYREHVQVGDELIHRVGTVKHRADFWAWERNKKTGTKNFDVVTVEDGLERTDI